MSDGDGVLSSSFSDGCGVLNNTLDDYHKLPSAVKRRVRALKKLQYETVKIDASFYKELLCLEMKYDIEHQRIFEKRREIIVGAREPKDDECDWPSDDEHPGADGDEVEKLCDAVGKKATVGNEIDEDASKGIPDFWLKTMQNVPLLDEIIQDHDVKILQNLLDIKCVLHHDEPGFTLEFNFSSNDYFTNKVLTKRYYFNYDISPEDPFDYEGPEIVRTKGCTINWNPGKNVTVKVIKKIQKKKGPGGGAKRTITKNVQEDSFFNFFDPPTQTLSEDLDEEIQLLLEADFKLGQFLRDSIVPKAVLFFTGEAVIPESDDEDEDDDEDEEDEEDSDAEEEESPSHNRGHHHRSGGGHKHDKTSSTEQPECKQQ